MIKVAVLWIVSDEGEIMLAQRAHHKAQDPSVWGPAVTGKLEEGESFEDALVREVEEEIGLTTADYTPRFLFEQDFDHPDGEQRKFSFYYALFPKAKSSLIRVDANEVAGFAWFPLATIKEKLKLNADELVPSANATWPGILAALTEAKAL